LLSLHIDYIVAHVQSDFVFLVLLAFFTHLVVV